MKKGVSVIAAALMMLVASVVWYSCKKEEIVVTGSIFGTVTDFATGQPVGNVTVKLRPSGTTTLTGSDGSYEFKDLDAGNYSLLLSKAEYADLDDDYTIKLEAGKDVRRDVQIRKKIASLQITDMNGQPLDTLDFGSEESVVIKTFNVFNDGTEVLTCSANYECEWITSVTGLENSIPSGQTVPVTVRIDRVALVDGDNTTLLYITSGNGSNEIVVKASFLGSAVITTSQATSVTASSATVGGNIADDGGRPVLARGICYGTSQTPTIDGLHTEDGSGTGTFSHNITDLSSSTTYYARAYATNRNSTYYSSNVISFTTGSGMPTVTTTDVTNVTASTAKSGGNVTNNGGFNVTARGVCWNTMGSPDISDEHTTNGNGNGVFTSNITNLSLGTTYYVRAYATNQSGTSYGVEKTFTTPNGAVTITLDAAQNITANSATFTANISDDGGVPVAQRGICWATTQYPDVNGSHTDVGMGTGSYTVTIPNLQAFTTYYVRAYAVNQAGTVYSAQRTFTTTNGLPIVTTAVVSNITANSAQCGGNISDNGGFNVTARGICWNTTGNPDLNGDYTTNGNGNGTFTANMTNLTPGTTYHVRAYATNSTGTVYGEDRTFTTTDGMPQVTTSTVTNITATSAVCGGNVTSDGGVAVTARGICWNTVGNPDLNGSHTTNGTGTGTFSSNLTALTPGVTYHVRAYATNSTGTVYGTEQTFTTTDGMPQVTTGVVSNITATSAVCGAEVTSDGGFSVTARGVCWNTSGNPDITSSRTTNGSGNGVFSGNITGLTANTTYHVRAYATNSTGTSYGVEKTFATSEGSITINIAAAANITATSATCSVTIADDGGASITDRGICWSTAQYPTTAGTSVSVGSGTGTFNAAMNNLTPSTMYYVRAYAVNAVGTCYSSQISFTTNNGLPTVTTGTVNNITATSAVCSGNVTSDGGIAVTAKGLCWGTSQYPTVTGDHSNNGSGTGSFNGSMSGLSIGTTYYVRAYATNSTGTVYGQQVSFTTNNGLPTVTTSSPTLTGALVSTGGNVSDDGGFPVTERGICYGPLPYPDITSTYSHTSNGIGTGYFSSSFSLPVGSGMYYIRAYATNANGTTYGEQVTVIQPYDELPTFTYNGHTYKVAPDQHTSTSQYISWSAAYSYCESLSYGGYSDWRMPTLEELQMMYQNRNSIGGFVYRIYNSDDYSCYWSSTESSSNVHYSVRWDTGSAESLSVDCEDGICGTIRLHVRPIRINN